MSANADTTLVAPSVTLAVQCSTKSGGGLASLYLGTTVKCASALAMRINATLIPKWRVRCGA